jgi:hypothetical protein
MDKYEFSLLIGFPQSFHRLNCYADSLFEEQYNDYLNSDDPLDENGLVVGAEHYRGGVYWHCYRSGLSRDMLFELLSLEPDPQARTWLLREMGF